MKESKKKLSSKDMAVVVIGGTAISIALGVPVLNALLGAAAVAFAVKVIAKQ